MKLLAIIFAILCFQQTKAQPQQVSGDFFKKLWRSYLETTGADLELLGPVEFDGNSYYVVAIDGRKLTDEERNFNSVREKAKQKGLISPSLEQAVVLQGELFMNNSVEDLIKTGLKEVVIMHDPLRDLRGSIFCLSHGVNGEKRAFFDRKCSLVENLGFVFLLPSPFN